MDNGWKKNMAIKFIGTDLLVTTLSFMTFCAIIVATILALIISRKNKIKVLYILMYLGNID